VAFAWLLQNPVASSVVGATTVEELEADLGALAVQLEPEVIERLDAIWSGPGEAPQAYDS
jgi:aryl-alcohol dehydrogenase-like predicted oxidoreductase